MKIQKITTNYQTKNNTQNFKGTVNGTILNGEINFKKRKKQVDKC